jgi:hypothetical protein
MPKEGRDPELKTTGYYKFDYINDRDGLVLN